MERGGREGGEARRFSHPSLRSYALFVSLFLCLDLVGEGGCPYTGFRAFLWFSVVSVVDLSYLKTLHLSVC